MFESPQTATLGASRLQILESGLRALDEQLGVILDQSVPAASPASLAGLLGVDEVDLFAPGCAADPPGAGRG